MAQTTNLIKTFTATAAIAAFRLVKLTSSSGTAVEYATASDAGVIGASEREAAINEYVPIKLRGPYCTLKLTAVGAIDVGATIYTAANGKVDATGTYAIGTALEAASGDGAVIEALMDAGTGSAPYYASLQNFNATYDIGVPVLLMNRVTNITAAPQTTTVWTAQRKLKIIDAYMWSRDTQAANVTLINGSDNVSAATAKGTADNTKVQFTVDDAYVDVASGGLLKILQSADSVIDVVIVAVPIA